MVQVYDPKKNVWRSIAELSAKRWKCGLVELGGFLYAVGGMDSPRAGFWGAPLSTGEGGGRRRVSLSVNNIFQSSGTVPELMSGLQ